MVSVVRDRFFVNEILKGQLENQIWELLENVIQMKERFFKSWKLEKDVQKRVIFLGDFLSIFWS